MHKIRTFIYNFALQRNEMMKRNVKTAFTRIFFFLLLVAVPYKGVSQDIRMGLFLDPLITWMNTNTIVNSNEGLRPGLSFGFTATKYFAPNYAISTGINYINAGGRMSSKNEFTMLSSNLQTVVSPGDEVIYKLKYLSFPIGLKLQTNQIGYLSYFADFGLDTRIMISSKYSIPAADIENESGSKEVNPLNLGWHITLGLEYSLGGTTSLTTGIGFDDNFFDITKDHEDSGQVVDRSTLKILRIRFGVIF